MPDTPHSQPLITQLDPEEQEQMAQEGYDDQYDVKTYLSWHAPGRPYRKRSKEYFINSTLITISIEIILVFFAQYLLMLVVFSLALLAFALAAVPPHEYYYRISSEGIRIEDHYFIWDELYDFYFMKRHGKDVLHVRTKAYFPGELTIVLGDVPLNQAKMVMRMFLPYREYVRPTFTEKATEWMETNFPLERTPAPDSK